MSSLKNILIVDDSKVNRQILRKILSSDYNIIEAENGQIALDILKEKYGSISVVLLDIIMPIVDGYEVLTEMHRDAFLSQIPVIVASGQDSEDAEVRALSLGANDYIIKPYKPEIIRHRIANTIYLKETSSFINSVQHDALTGVYSKDYFYMKAKEALQNNPSRKYDLICMDIERFKLVNDIYGMKVGDDLLKHFGEIIMESVGEYGFCGRIGADEFICLIPHRNDYQKTYFDDAIERINNFSSAVKFNLIIRYGIYYIEDPSTPINIMCDRAILAKGSIKGKYDTYFAYYDDAIRQKLLSEQMIVSDMKTALAENQFKVYFQPKYDLKTEEIIGAEALVRWVHPEKGFMSPGEFIPLFEKNGFITDLDMYVWDLCCQKMKAWMDAGNVATPISINVSRVDIYDPNLPQILISMIQKYELSPKYLHLEITESAYTENAEQLIEMVSKLKKLGFIIEMDDFGTGYSSLNMLSELPIDILKLDMRFIQKEEEKHTERSVLSFIISLAKWMNLKVVAEGIETEAQVQLLQSLNCEYAQGFYFARPMPQEQFEQHLLNGRIQPVDRDKNVETVSLSQFSERRHQLMVVLEEESIGYTQLENDFGNRYNVKKANNSHEALELLNKNKDNIFILIISMPYSAMEEELTDMIENYKKHNIPIVALFDENNKDVFAPLEWGLSDYIKMPYDPNQINLRMKNAFAFARMEKFQQEKEINAAIIEMRKRAEHDALTGLLNRAEYEVRIDHFFHENDDPKGIFIIMDVDNFKMVNDTFGHVAGDKVLDAMGESITRIFPETDIISRIGGDEFSLFIPYVIPMSQLHSKMNKLCSCANLNIDNLSISCSAGVCFSPEFGINHKDLYKNADMALITAKRHGKAQYQIYSMDMEIPNQSILEQNAKVLLDNASDAMFVCDYVTSKIIYINETACKLLGKDRESCIGTRCYQLFWDRCRNCDRCEYIDGYLNDFYEETTLLKDHKTKVHIKARMEEWEGKKVKVHYLQLGNNGN